VRQIKLAMLAFGCTLIYVVEIEVEIEVRSAPDMVIEGSADLLAPLSWSSVQSLVRARHRPRETDEGSIHYADYGEG